MQVSAARRLAPGGVSAGDIAPLVIAHRGATAHAPENSLAAFEAAIVAGADMVEFDVRLTADDVLVVHHDSSVHGVPVSRLTMAELRELHEAVTTLTEALALCSGRIAVDVELKVAGVERRVLDLLEWTLDPASVVVTSLLEEVIAEVKRLEPELVCGLLLGPGRLGARAFRERPFYWLHRCGADFLLPHQLLVPVRRRRAAARPGLVVNAEERGVPLVVWTVNRPERLTRYFAQPVFAGVITDAPELATAARGDSPPGEGPSDLAAGGVTGAIRRTFRRQVRPEPNH
jgi:glycerophosphoryl diester phosphodiesterase